MTSIRRNKKQIDFIVVGPIDNKNKIIKGTHPVCAIVCSTIPILCVLVCVVCKDTIT